MVTARQEHTTGAPQYPAAIPSLRGYVGIDFIQTEEGPMVLEINPRLTTSYCGLRSALGVNVADLVLQLFRSGTLPAITRRRAAERIDLAVETPGD